MAGIFTGSASPSHSQEDHDLVPGTFHEELEERVLIRGSEGRHRGRPHVHLPPLPVPSLPERLGPELLEPCCERSKAIGVGHEDVDRSPLHGVGMVKKGGQKPRRVLSEDGGPAPLGHVPGTVQNLHDVDSHHRRRKESHRGENGKPSAHVGRDLQGRDSLLVGDLSEDPGLGIGREEEMPPGRLFPQDLMEHGPPPPCTGTWSRPWSPTC